MFNRLLGGLGRTLITAGTLILLFVAYQLWGTAIHEARAQKELTSEFDELLASVEAPAPSPNGSPDTDPARPSAEELSKRLEGWLPEIGAPVAKIEIPDIGIKRTVVEGDDDAQLKRGMGHVAASPLPGQEGNVSIAGHRTTYGQPLHNIDKLEVGDLIHFETLYGDFTYEVFEHQIVDAKAVEVMEDRGDNRLTLIACHPKYSLAQRYIVFAELVDEPAPELEGQDELRHEALELAGGEISGGSLDGDSASRVPVALWFLICALIWVATWLVQTLLRRRMRARAAEHGSVPDRRDRLVTWSPYLLGVPVFLVALYFFFESFSALLPGSY